MMHPVDPGDGDEDNNNDDGFVMPSLASLKKKDEPVDEEHESSRTQHYSKLGAAFVSSNVLNRGRSGRGGPGRGRGF